MRLCIAAVVGVLAAPMAARADVVWDAISNFNPPNPFAINANPPCPILPSAMRTVLVHRCAERW